MKHFATTHNSSGNTLILAVILSGTIVVLALAILDFSRQNSRVSVLRVNEQEAVRIAESGIEKAVWCLKNPSAPTSQCPGNPTYTGESNVSLGNGTFTVNVTGTGNTRTVTASGTAAGVTKDLEVQLTTTTTDVSFQYGVQAGLGGFSLSNNAFVSGNIYSAGNVIGSNNSYITGDAFLTASAPTLDQVSDPPVSPLYTLNVGTNGSTNDWLAQSFVPSITERVYSLDLKIAKHGNPSSVLTAYIYSDSSNNPGSDLTAGGKQVTVTVPNDSSGGWENGWTTQAFTPSTNPILLAGQKYWLVLRTSSTNSSNYWVSVRSASGDDTVYAGGTAKLDGDGTAMPAACSPSLCDISFRINMGGVQPTLDIPNVNGTARAYNITNTTMGNKAYYHNLSGTVRADTSDTCTDGENGPNCFDLDTTGGSDPTPVDFPLSDAQITQMEAEAEAGGIVPCSPTCNLTDGSSVGPKKYIGNVNLSNNVNVTLTGTIWVVGNLTIDNNAGFTLSSAYGSSSGVIIADNPNNRTTVGTMSFSNNGNLQGNGTTGTYIMAVSMFTHTTNTAINVSNNLSAGILYAPHGNVFISNNASLKEVSADKITLDNNASVTYEQGLADVNFTSGPGGSWTYQRGTYKIL